MVKQILVKTPLTTNGTDPVFDANDKRTYTESILLDVPGKSGARAILEQRNSTLPTHLKLLISDYVEPVPEVIHQQPIIPQISLLDQLKLQAENDKLKQQLADMQKQSTVKTVKNATA